MTVTEQELISLLKRCAKKYLDNEHIDWEYRRYEAAKDILVGLCANTGDYLDPAKDVEAAIKIADELIKQLRNENT